MSQETEEQLQDGGELVAARRAKLEWHRTIHGIDPYGHRVDGLVSLAEARAQFDESANEVYASSIAAHKDDESVSIVDERPVALVAGRIVQHRDVGKLIFHRAAR